jgi:hypothetical protein
MGFVVKLLNFLWEIIREHYINFIFVAISYSGVIIPAFEFQHGKSFFKLFDFLFDGSLSMLK